ncbi:MAG: hypothetical protein ACREKL_03575, partial [Chthoniobacterales bacterium]
MPPLRIILPLLIAACSVFPWPDATAQSDDPAPPLATTRRTIRPKPIDASDPVVTKAPAASQPDAATESGSSNPWKAPIELFQFQGSGTLQTFADKIQSLLAKDGVRVIAQSGGTDPLPDLFLPDTNLEKILNRLMWTTRGAFQYDVRVGSGDKPLLVLEYKNRTPSDMYLPEFDFKGGTVQDLANKIQAEKLGWTNIHVNPAA